MRVFYFSPIRITYSMVGWTFELLTIEGSFLGRNINSSLLSLYVDKDLDGSILFVNWHLRRIKPPKKPKYPKEKKRPTGL